MFVATHEGKRSRNRSSGWDGAAGRDAACEGFGDFCASEEGDIGLDDMEETSRGSFLPYMGANLYPVTTPMFDTYRATSRLALSTGPTHFHE